MIIRQKNGRKNANFGEIWSRNLSEFPGFQRIFSGKCAEFSHEKPITARKFDDFDGFFFDFCGSQLKRAIACTNTLTILYDEGGEEKSTGVLIDVANMVVTSQTFALDIREAEQFAREKKIPELTIIPYSPIYRNGYGDDHYLVGAADAQRFYRGDDVDNMMKKLAPFLPQPYQPDLSLKVIDFDLLGNQAILYLGKPDIESYDGNGWDDAPYEFYADKVDGTYIADAIVLNFPADAFVYQASAYQDACPELGIDGYVSKNTLHKKRIPCILYSRDGKTYGEIHFDDVIGDVMKEADVFVSKLKHLA